MKKVGRLAAFLVGLRWAALLCGTLFVGLKSSTSPAGEIHALLWRHNTIFLLILFAFEFTISLLQSKACQDQFVGWIVVVSDILCGALAVFTWGSAFFLLACLIPILESFLISDPAGISVFLLDFFFLSFFLIQEQLSSATDATRLPARLLGGELFISFAIFWLFLLAKEQEYDVVRFRTKGEEEKKLLQGDLETSQKELDKLHRERLANQKEIDSLKSNAQTTLNSGKEEAQIHVQEALRGEEEAKRKLNDLLQEIEESRKERQNLNFLMETSGQMHESLQMEETLTAVVETLRKVLPSQTYIIFLIEEERKKQRLYTEIAASPYSDYFRNYNVELGEGVVGWVAREGEPAIIENSLLRTADGHEFTTLITSERSAIVAPMRKRDGSPLGVLYLGQSQPHAYSWQDVNVLLRFIPHIQTAISKSRRYHEAISQGILDPLTGLYNKAYLDERLAEEVKRASRYKLPIAMVLLQIDHYEKLAAELDEQALNQGIKEVSEMLKGYLRDVDVLARIGDDRFAFVLVQAEKASAVLISERIRLAIEMRMFGETGRRIKLTASIGVAGQSKTDAGKLDYMSAKTSLLAKCASGLQDAVSKGGNKTCLAA